MHNHDLEKQNDPWDIDSFSYAPADVCNSQRRGSARRAVGSVPGDCWGVGDLRFAVRETEIVSSIERSRVHLFSTTSDQNNGAK